MKTTKSFIVILFALLTAQATFAWYDPSSQRWLTRDPIGEPGFEALRTATTMPQIVAPLVVSPGRWINRDAPTSDSISANLYTFVKNNPVNDVDYLGLKDPGALLDALWEATKAGTEYAGDEASLMEIFGGCGGLSVVLAYAEEQYHDCLADAWAGPPSKDAACEKSCEQKWSHKIDVLKDIQNKECKGKD